MKDKKWILVLVGLVILTSLNTYGETRKLREIGRFPFIPITAGTSAPEIMKIMAENYTDDIRRGFELAGQPNLYLPFMDRVRQSAFSERDLAVGTRLEWMVFRSGAQIKVIHDLEWAGKEPLPVLSFTVQDGNNKYELIMPKSCGNISLERVEMGAAPGREQEPAKQARPYEEKPEERYDISKAKIYQDIGDLIHEVDLYCSFFIWENEIPELRISGAEREYEKSMFSDGDIIYLNKGTDGGIEPGQVFWVLEITNILPGYAPMAFGKGQARVQFTSATQSVAVVENSCDGVRRGYCLVPFEKREGMTGKDLGYDVLPVEAEGTRGHVLYLQANLRQIAGNHWALIDLGEEQGIQVGQQLILYRKIRDDLPVQILGNCVVTDVGRETATIKILSSKDVIRMGDRVMERPSQ